MSSSGHQIRVGFMRMMMQSIDRAPTSERQALMGAVGELHDAIMGASMLGWMNGDVNLEVIERIHVDLGPERAAAFFGDHFRRVYAEAPFMASFVKGLVRLTGDPGGYLRFLPRGYRQIFRNFGEWEVGERGEGWAEAALVDPPARVFDLDAAWLIHTAAALESFFDLVDVRGEVRLVSVDPPRRAVMRFSWER